MDTVASIDYSGLKWVKHELDETLRRAGQALDLYVEVSDDPGDLERFIDYLHQVHGTLQMVELYGAAMLAEEMELVAKALLSDTVGQREHAYEVLMRATLLLPNYLETLQSGHKDIPIVLLPLLNELRANRGAHLLTESAFFSPDLGAIQAQPDPSIEETGAGEGCSLMARKFRYHFQRGLLEVFRGAHVTSGLQKLVRVAEQLYENSRLDPVAQLWRIAAGFIDSLIDAGGEVSVAIKPLLGQIDRQLGRLIDLGEQGLAVEPDIQLVKNLLYYVATSRGQGERIKGIQEDFGLACALPTQDEIETASNNLRAPNAELMGAVTGVIRENIAAVKDGLDLFIRGARRGSGNIAEQADTLAMVADTLGMLGQGPLRIKVHEQVEALRRLAAIPENDPDESEVMQIASELLVVESSLEDILPGCSQPGDGVRLAESAALESDIRPADYLSVVDDTLSEVRVEIAKVKEAIVAFIDAPESQRTLANVMRYFSHISGALTLLAESRAKNILNTVSHYVEDNLIETQAVPNQAAFEALADAISSVEYYLEAVQENRVNRAAILDLAEASLVVLGQSSSDAATLEEMLEPAEHTTEVTEVSEADAAAPLEKSPPSHDEDGLDDEILDIFFEEAQEQLELIKDYLPKWRNNPDDVDALATVRRSFHTLKGSGRLVGAMQIGEFAWAIENMLNRAIDHTVDVTPAMHDLLAETVAVLAGLIESLRAHDAPKIDVQDLTDRADGMSTSAVSVNDDTPDADAEPEEAVSADVEKPELALEAPDVAGLDACPEPEAEPRQEKLDTDRQGGPETQVGADLSQADVAAVEQSATSEPLPDAEIESAELADVPVETDRGITLDPVQPPAAVIDPVLYEIFSSETENHLGEIRDFIDRCRTEDGPRQVDNEVIRALHTLQGSAHMAGVLGIATLGRELELAAKTLKAKELPIDAVRIAVFEDVVRVVADILASLQEPHLGEIDFDELVQRIRTLPEPMSLPAEDAKREESGAAETSTGEILAESSEGSTEPDDEMLEIFLEEGQEMLASIEAAVLEWDQEPDESAHIEALQRALHTLKGSARLVGFTVIGNLSHALESTFAAITDGRLSSSDTVRSAVQHGIDGLVAMFENLRTGRAPGIAEPFIRELEALLGPSESEQEAPQREPARESSQEAPAPASSAIPSPSEPQNLQPEAHNAAVFQAQDAELIGMFVEEGRDLLDAIDHAIQDWNAEPGNSQTIERLQRSLHTLKGGARLAGLEPAGRLAHALESMLTAIVTGRVQVSKQVLTVTQRCIDRLVVLVDEAEQGAPLSPVAPLLEELDHLISEAPSAGLGAAEDDLPELAEENLHEGEKASVSTQTTPGIAADSEPIESVPPKAVRAVEEVAPAPASAKEKPGDAADETPASLRAPREQIRVRAELLDNLVNNAGEVSIFRARLEQQNHALQFNVSELGQTVSRLHDQLRKLEIETERQILFRYEKESVSADDEFDPLELDRFSQMQQLSRSLVESVSDLINVKEILDDLTDESETLLRQQARVNTDLQESLMRTRMVPFASVVPRLRRLMRQTCEQMKKQANLRVEGAEGEMDRTVLDRMIAPLEHMLRNSIAHGIEDEEERRAKGKKPNGTVTLQLSREGNQVLLEVADDGAGIDLNAVRKKAAALNLIAAADAPVLTDHDVLQFILESGFSTAGKVTQIAGRGVGMDVVNSEIKQLGGSLQIDSKFGQGTRFTVQLPFTLAITQALLVHVETDLYAVPHASVEGVVRIFRSDLLEHYAGRREGYEYAGYRYDVQHLGQVLGFGAPLLDEKIKWLPVLLVRAGEHRVALQVDSLLGAREIVVKSVGPQLSTVGWISGGTILADGSVALILDVTALVRRWVAQKTEASSFRSRDEAEGIVKEDRPVALMVVDDSLTVRKVTGRLLERNGMEVMTAKDGVDAVAKLQERIPDIMLLDIEMPRMDGYELARHMRNTQRLKDIPIIMITSRTGEKHRRKAIQIGVNRYLGKPYQESELLETINQLLEAQVAR